MSLLAALLLAGCADPEPEPLGPARAAEPQQAKLGWRERYPASGPGLVFRVEALTVRANGWSAEVAVTNRTRIPFTAGREAIEHAYGLMLFATGDLGELEDAARADDLPAVRQATTIEPELPSVLRPGQTWRATLSAPGSLADGSWVRVSFGPLEAQGDPPEEMERVVVWITDRAHRI